MSCQILRRLLPGETGDASSGVDTRSPSVSKIPSLNACPVSYTLTTNFSKSSGRKFVSTDRRLPACRLHSPLPLVGRRPLMNHFNRQRWMQHLSELQSVYQKFYTAATPPFLNTILPLPLSLQPIARRTSACKSSAKLVVKLCKSSANSRKTIRYMQSRSKDEQLTVLTSQCKWHTDPVLNPPDLPDLFFRSPTTVLLPQQIARQQLLLAA